MRLLTIFSIFVFLSSPALAGFEWLPPSQNPQAVASHSDKGFVDTSPHYLPNNQLVINPYPLGNDGGHHTMTAATIEEAMLHEANILNPVRLSGMNKTSTQERIVTRHKDHGAAATIQSVMQPMPKPPVEAIDMLPSSLTPATYSAQDQYQMLQKESAHTMQSAPPQMATSIQQHYPDAVGFGRDLPLVIALSQVIPEGYNHGFAGGVNAGVTVSWEGGRPWTQVLNDMLATHNMRAIIDGRMITIAPLS